MRKIIIIICALVAATAANAQIITTFAGSDTGGYCGDGMPAIYTCISHPTGLAVDGFGNVYIADEWNNRIRKVDTAGIVHTVAGNGIYGYRGDDSLATGAEFCDIAYIGFGPDGNLYIPDICNNRIRKLDVSTGIITTAIGTGVFGYSGTGVFATAASLYYPFSVAFSPAGHLVFSQASNRIFEVDDAGNLKLLAGSDSLDGFAGDGGPATAAIFNHPADIAFDPWGNMYVSDLDNGVVRMVDTFGLIHPFAGTDTTFGYLGDGGPATLAILGSPEGIVTDGAGNVFFSDEVNSAVRRVDHETHIITTIAGTGVCGFSGDGGPATAAKLCEPVGLAFDADGNLYISDYTNNRVRKVTNAGVPLRAKQPPAPSDGVKVYPNPATTQLTVEGARGCALTLVDAVGQTVWSLPEAGMKQVVPLASLAPGIYTLAAVNAVTGERTCRMVEKR